MDTWISWRECAKCGREDYCKFALQNKTRDLQCAVAVIEQLLILGIETAVGQQDTRNVSGSWYHPATDEQGFYIEVLPNNQAVVIWFGYDTQGQQRWIIGAGHVDGNRIDIRHAYQATGGIFGGGLIRRRCNATLGAKWCSNLVRRTMVKPRPFWFITAWKHRSTVKSH